MQIQHQIIFFIVGLVLLFILASYWPSYSVQVKESFTSPISTPQSLDYSSVYAKLYDKVYSYDDYYKAECLLIHTILKQHNAEPWTRGIDLGTGTGRHYKYLSTGGPLLGIDKDPAMVAIAQQRNPDGEFMVADFRKPNLIPMSSVDIVFLLGESLYVNGGSEQLNILREIRNWMRPDGFLVIHFWNGSELDPSPQPYSQFIEGGHSVTYFENLQHESWFSPRKEVGSAVYDFNEIYTITLDDGTKKENEHTTRVFFPPDRKTMMELLDKSGWKLVEVKDLSSIGLKDREIFFLQSK